MAIKYIKQKYKLIKSLPRSLAATSSFSVDFYYSYLDDSVC